MASQGLPLPLRLCFLYFSLLMLCMSSEKFKSGVSCSETLHSNVSDFEGNDHLQMVTKRRSPPPPSPPPPPPPPPPLPPFNHYILALQWPPSICKSKTCDISPVPKQFTIHGLWPNTGSTGCNPNDKFEYLKLPKATRDRLDKEWPGLVRTAGGQQQFLGHEWTKHGTCSGLTQQVYFETALDRHGSVNVLNRLADWGRDSQGKPISFVPGPNNKYYPSDIITAYENKWKLRIKIVCVKKRGTTEEMIGEIHFKVNKDAKTVESITGSTTSGCTPNTKASFPINTKVSFP